MNSKFVKLICLVLVLSMCIAVPVNAAEISPYASAYFTSHNTYLWDTSDSSFQIWFIVTAANTMKELGVNYIEVERSSDGVNWSVVKTYTKANNSNFIAYDTTNHSGYVTYSNKQSGYQYRAYIELYAKNYAGGVGYSGTYAYF